MFEEAEGQLRNSMMLLSTLDDVALRERAYRSVDSYVQYIYATATGGSGPVAAPPAPHGKTTTGTFKCPNCGHNGTSTYK